MDQSVHGLCVGRASDEMTNGLLGDLLLDLD